MLKRTKDVTKSSMLSGSKSSAFMSELSSLVNETLVDDFDMIEMDDQKWSRKQQNSKRFKGNETVFSINDTEQTDLDDQQDGILGCLNQVRK